MKIYSVNNINFTSSQKFVKPPQTIDTALLNKIRNNIKDDTRKGLYNNIDSYINKKFTKKEYLENIDKFIKKIDNKSVLNRAERRYINNMLMTMDLSERSGSISDKYILENISKLLKYQK